MKRVFLIDFENVHISGLKGVKSLSEEDGILLFYSKDQEDSVFSIIELRDDIRCVEIVKNGQNSLDFQLSSYLGFIIKEAISNNELDSTHFFIISKDSGFNTVCDFWTKTQLVKQLKICPHVLRADNIQSALQLKVKNPVPAQNAEILQKNKKQQTIDTIMKASKNLQDFHGLLVKEYGMQEGRDLYNANKAKFKEIGRV